MLERPKEQLGPQWNWTVVREDRSIFHNAMVVCAFTLACVLPTAIWPDRGFVQYGNAD